MTSLELSTNSIAQALSNLQEVMSDNTYSIHISPCLKNTNIQYQLKHNDRTQYVGTDGEIVSFINGVIYVATTPSLLKN